MSGKNGAALVGVQSRQLAKPLHETPRGWPARSNHSSTSPAGGLACEWCGVGRVQSVRSPRRRRRCPPSRDPTCWATGAEEKPPGSRAYLLVGVKGRCSAPGWKDTNLAFTEVTTVPTVTFSLMWMGPYTFTSHSGGLLFLSTTSKSTSTSA